MFDEGYCNIAVPLRAAATWVTWNIKSVNQSREVEMARAANDPVFGRTAEVELAGRWRYF